jgi:hypothetical protein
MAIRIGHMKITFRVQQISWKLSPQIAWKMTLMEWGKIPLPVRFNV